MYRLLDVTSNTSAAALGHSHAFILKRKRKDTNLFEFQTNRFFFLDESVSLLMSCDLGRTVEAGDMKGWEGKSLPTGSYVSYFPNVSIMRRLVSACWASCSARAISRTSRSKWKVRSREMGDSSDLFSTCSAPTSIRRCASLNRVCLSGVESEAVVPRPPSRRENSSPRCSSRGRRTVGESTARQSAGGGRKVASRAAHINTLSFMSTCSCKQIKNQLSAISIQPVTCCPLVAGCLAPLFHFSSEPITDILCLLSSLSRTRYSNIYVSNIYGA